MEEVGLTINPELGTFVAVRARNFKNPELIWKDISLFFVLTDFEGEPVNKEPRLHDAMEWFDKNHLPEPIIPVVKVGIEQYLRGELYGEFRTVSPLFRPVLTGKHPGNTMSIYIKSVTLWSAFLIKSNTLGEFSHALIKRHPPSQVSSLMPHLYFG